MDIDEYIKKSRINKMEVILLAYARFEEMPERNMLYEKTLRVPKDEKASPSYRLINHWTDLGLIEDSRESNKQWRKFSIADIIWSKAIIVMRKFGLANSKILKIKESLFEVKNKNGGTYDPFVFYIARALLGDPVSILIYQDDFADIATDDELNWNIHQANKDFNNHHLRINLNILLQGSLGLKFAEGNYHLKFTLDNDELKILEMIREKKYESLEIIFQDGKIERLLATQDINVDERIVDILKQAQYQEIKIQTAGGKIVSIKRTEKKKSKTTGQT